VDGVGGLLDGLQEPEHLLPATSTPVEELPTVRRPHNSEGGAGGAESRGRMLGEWTKGAAGELKPGEVSGGEPAGGEDLPDEVSR